MDTYRLTANRPFMFCALALVLGIVIQAEAGGLKAAVVWVDAGEGVDPAFASELTDRLSAELATSAKYAVIAEAEVVQRLANAEFARPAGQALPALAATAGRIAGADVAVYGECYREANSTVLLTTMVRVSDGHEIRSIQSTYGGKDSDFLTRVPPHNVKTMLTADAEYAASEAATAAAAQVADLPAAPVRMSKTAEASAAPKAPGVRMPDFDLPDINWGALDSANWVKPDSFIARRIEVGTRMMHFELTDDRSGSFLGSINAMEAMQDQAPERLFVHVKINPLWRFEIVVKDDVKARTRTQGGKSDGNVEITGPIVTLQRYFPNETRFVPYVGAGVAFYGAHFDESTHWSLGYANPQEWESLGRPTTLNGGRSREIGAEENISPVVQGGCTWYFADHWAADLQARYVSSTVDATFISRVNGRRTLTLPGEFPMDHFGFLLGIRYIPGSR